MPPKTRCSQPSSSVTTAARRSSTGISELVAKAGKKKCEYTAPEINKELYAKIETQIRAELTDALDTKKYPKLESYHRVDEAKNKVVEAHARRAAGRSRRACSTR